MKRIEETSEGVRIQLTRGQWALIDKGDLMIVAQYSWQAMPRSAGVGYYATTRTADRKTLYMHRFILNPPDGNDVDHVNGETLDNRRSNLRFGSRSQNMQNRRGANKNSTTGVRGVYIQKLVYKSRVCPDRKTTTVSYNARYMIDGKSHTKNFPFTPEGLEAAKAWVEDRRAATMSFSRREGR
jgi:hypothetical protein